MDASKFFSESYTQLDHYWTQSPEYYSFWLDKVTKLLDLHAEDFLCDIGTGQGGFTQQLVRKCHISRCLAIEPYVNVHKEFQDGLTIIKEQPIDYLKQNKPSITKVLFKQVIHHFSPEKQLELFQIIYSLLPTGGKVMVMTMPPEIEFPMFQGAKDFFKAHQIHYRECANRLKIAGFNAVVHKEDFPVSISHAGFAHLIQTRFLSDLRDFSDDELAAGIKSIPEIDLQRPEEIMQFSDSLYCIVGEKQTNSF